MIRVHSRKTSARRRAAALALAAVATTTPALAAPGSDEGITKSDALEMIRESRVENGTLANDADSQTISVQQDPFQVAAGCFTELDGREKGEKVRQSTMFIVTFYENGDLTVSTTGSGVIVKSDSGMNRLLTAGHVAPGTLVSTPEGEDDPVTFRRSRVLAFAHDGRLMAELRPILYGESGNRIEGWTETSAESDYMVMAPWTFYGEDAARDWQDAGLEIAPVQSSSYLFLFGQREEAVITPGISGGPVLNGHSQIVGIISESQVFPSDIIERPDTSMPSATLNERTREHLSPDEFRDLHAGFVADSRSGEIKTSPNATGIAIPITPLPVLSSLGIDPTVIEIDPGMRQSDVTVAGYPDSECRTGDLTSMTYPDVPFTPDTDSIVRLSMGHALVSERKLNVGVMTPDGEMIMGARGGRAARAEVRKRFTTIFETGFASGLAGLPIGLPDAGEAPDPEDIEVEDPFDSGISQDLAMR